MARTRRQSDLLNTLFRSGREYKYQKGELILRAQETPRGVYFIESGLVKIYSVTKQQDEHVYHFFGPGDFFSTNWTFRNILTDYYYEALAPTTLRVIPRETLMQALDSDPVLLRQMFEEMVERYMLYTARISNLLYSDARQRCAYRLLSLANRFGFQTPDGLVIDAVITHEDLAHSISMTRETFGRLLSRLQSKGILAYDDQRRIVVKDLDSLMQVIGREEVALKWPALMKYLPKGV